MTNIKAGNRPVELKYRNLREWWQKIKIAAKIGVKFFEFYRSQ